MPKFTRKIRGCDLSRLIKSISRLSEMRRGGKPRITITTVMLKDTIGDLPELVKLAKFCEADEVIANNLDYIPTKDLLGLEVFSEKVDPKVDEILNNARVIAKDLGINLAIRPIKFEEALVCAENPLKSCFILAESSNFGLVNRLSTIQDTGLSRPEVPAISVD